MAKINIPFKGMGNVPDDGAARDGELLVGINVRHEGGEIVQRNNPSREYKEDVGEIYFHGSNGHLIAITEDGMGLKDITDRKGTKVILENFPATISKVSFMGNIVKIEGAGVPHFMMWKNNEYIYLGELPSSLEVGYSVEHHVDELITRQKYKGINDISDSKASDNDYNILWNHVAGGYFDKLLKILHDKKRYIDCALFVVAARLFDGSYIQLSTIDMVEDKRFWVGATSGVHIGGKLNNFFNILSPYTNNNTGEQGRVYICSMEIGVNLPKYDFSGWRDVITSIDVFSSGSIMYHAKKAYTVSEKGFMRSPYGDYWRGVSHQESYEQRPIKNIVEDISGALFYRIASYDLRGELISAVTDTSPSNLAVQTRLENLHPNYIISGKVVKNYNAREHLAGVTKRYKGFVCNLPNDNTDINEESYYERTNIGKVTIVTHIQSEDKIIKTKRVVDNFAANVISSRNSNGTTSIGDTYYIAPMLHHTDSRVTKMEYYVEGRGEKGDVGYIPKVRKVFDFRPGVIGAFYVNEVIENSNKGFKLSPTPGYRWSLDESLFEKFVDDNISGYETELNVFTLAIKNDKWVMAWRDAEIEVNSLSDIGIKIEKANDDNIIEDVTSSYKGEINIEYTPAGMALEYGTLEPIALVSTSDTAVDYDIPAEDDTESVDNVLYVSETDNPFYYPYTYKFGSPIVAMESSAEEVSAGQFGQYPMNVFTGEGIWALSVDTTGKGAYGTQTPLSREVCSGKPCAIPRGVAFPTMNGVKILQGSNVVDITSTMMGERDIVPGIADRIAEGMKLQMPGMRFGNFLKRVKIAYDYTTNEVVLYSDDNDVMYRYGVSTGMWTMEGKAFDAVIPAYPQLITVKSERGGKVVYTYDNTPESERPSDVSALPADIMLFTRPMRLGMYGRKRVSQVALRGTWTGAVSLYILGSNDGKEYKVIAGKEGVGGELHRDVVTRFCRSNSYEYIAVCVTGKNFEGRLTGVEIIAEPGIGQNMLR